MSNKYHEKEKEDAKRRFAEESKKYVVEKGIKIPEYYLTQWKRYQSRENARGTVYPFKQMEIGDSFAIPAGKSEKSFRMLTATYGSRHNMKFIVVRDDEHKYRCWRMA